MFIGHFAVGFASKRLAPRTSLATLIAASLFADILLPVFLLTGLEHIRIVPGITAVMPFDSYDYPWSHSLLTTVVYAIGFGGVYFALRRDRTASLVLGGGVLGHFFLDWVSHRPDVQFFPGGSSRVGLGLWYSLPATLVVEGAMFVAAVALYVTGTRARNRKGSLGLWSFVTFLVAAYLGSVLGPPPPSVKAMASVAIVANLLLFWIAWFDRHREPIVS